MKEINSTEEFNTIVSSSSRALIYFHAVWCGPCKLIKPVLKDLEAKHPDVEYLYIDVDNNQELAAMFNVRSIPTMLMMKDGKQERQVIGFRPLKELEEFIK